MCTAATYQTRDFYMGRTLDYEFSYGEEIVITHEGMTPRFMLDGIEYRAVRYSSHVRNIPILRTRNMPLWPDKATMLLVLGALGIGYGFRGWYLYYNDRDQ